MKVYNIPIQCSVDLYKEAINEYVKIISKFPEVISIVQIGNVGVAGISDIDLIVYLDDTLECKNKYSIYQIANKYHHLLMHDVFIIPYRFMHKSFLMTSIFETKVIYGNQLIISKYVAKEKMYQDLILLNDQAVVSLADEYDKWMKIKNKDIKLIIARVNSIKYPVILLKNILQYINIKSDFVQEYEEFVTQFSLFRTKWFDNDIDENIIKLFEFVQIAKEKIAPKLIDDIIKINKTINHTKFVNNEIVYKGVKAKNASIFINLIYYSKYKGSISKHINDDLQFNILIKDINFIYKNILNDRITMINEVYDFRDKNKICYGDLWTFGKIVKKNLIKRIYSKLIRLYNQKNYICNSNCKNLVENIKDSK